ncbi:hypothetical protein M3Y99_00569500 [Aphelenchoides fujianensis]|nr:hypothetical protein M3Y99_00569500 [Aphelenchoides fujianensis]
MLGPIALSVLLFISFVGGKQVDFGKVAQLESAKCVQKSPVVLFGRCAHSVARIRTLKPKFTLTFTAPNATFDPANSKLDITLTIGGCAFELDFEMEADNTHEWLPYGHQQYEPVIYIRQVNSTLHSGGHLPLSVRIDGEHMYRANDDQPIQRNCRVEYERKGWGSLSTTVEMRVERNGRPATHPTFRVEFSKEVDFVSS